MMADRRLLFVIVAVALSLGGCSSINWQGAYNDWAESVCRENGSQCAEP